MRKLVLAAIAAASVGAVGAAVAQQDDAAFAATLWQEIEAQRLVGANLIGAVPYAREGQAHGATLATFVSTATVGGVEGQVVVKRSYTDAATREGIIGNPAENLDNITVMFKREAGYDPANQDWFWAMYMPDGMVGEMGGMMVAGMAEGCSGCHAAAPGGDYLYLH